MHCQPRLLRFSLQCHPPEGSHLMFPSLQLLCPVVGVPLVCKIRHPLLLQHSIPTTDLKRNSKVSMEYLTDALDHSQSERKCGAHIAHTKVTPSRRGEHYSTCTATLSCLALRCMSSAGSCSRPIRTPRPKLSGKDDSSSITCTWPLERPISTAK